MDLPPRNGRFAGRSQARLGRRSRVIPVVLVGLAAIFLSACQVNVDVGTKVNEDGSGTITVAAGLDDAAVARLGKPEVNIKLDDLKAAGWEFAPPAKEADGLTWYRGTHSFATLDEGTQILKQLTGGKGAFRDFALSKDSAIGRTTWSYKGTVDLTGGISQFGDPELASSLKGDQFGGNIAAVEKEEGKPVGQMFALRISAELPGGEKKEWKPSFADKAPTQLAAESSQTTAIPVLPTDGGGLAIFVIVGVGIVVAVALLFFLRRRFRHVR